MQPVALDEEGHRGRRARGRAWGWVVPILFLEFFTLSMPAGMLPIIVNDHFGKSAYLLAGVAMSAKGFLSFLTSPGLGALSDVLEGDANEDFNAFCQQAADNVFPIVLHLCKNYP